MQAKLLRVIERKKIFPLGAAAGSGHRGPLHFFGRQPPSPKRCAAASSAPTSITGSRRSASLSRPCASARGTSCRCCTISAGSTGDMPLDSARSAQNCCDYPWPGNIRELENFVFGLSVRGCALDEKEVWTLLDRPREYPADLSRPANGRWPRSKQNTSPTCCANTETRARWRASWASRANPCTTS